MRTMAVFRCNWYSQFLIELWLRGVILREIFARLLKALWIFNIVYIVGFLALATIFVVVSIFNDDGLYKLDREIGGFIGTALLTTSILVFLQYVLLGSFNPKRLLNRGNF